LPEADSSALPLSGLLVVALEQAVAAPLASARLADAGARVIKIERAEGDFARGYDSAAGDASSYFVWLNRGKESLVLDIKDPEDSALLHRILAKADVFIQNLAVGAADRAGFGSEKLRRLHPSLITCDISGYGDQGAYADMKAYDLLLQAESGLVSVSGAPGPMGRIGVSLCDIGTGITAFAAILEALLRRQKSGRGESLKISLFDTMAEWMAVPLLHHDYLGAAPERVGLAHPSIAPYGAFPTKDGDLLLISIQSDREWRLLAERVLEKPDLGSDVRFATNRARVANRAETDGLVAQSFAKRTRAALTELLRTTRIAFGVINDVQGLSKHPQLRRRPAEFAGKEVLTPAHPVIAEGRKLPSHVPGIGEQDAAIRREFS
jgi:crotonobetainyl-CoA:carnitine CoA-transferase CaiB-like acyl-CoA transferase